MGFFTALGKVIFIASKDNLHENPFLVFDLDTVKYIRLLYFYID
jgi:hypothetical protein